MDRPPFDRINELNDEITKMALGSTAPEPMALFHEGSGLIALEAKWAMAGKVIGAVVGIVVFFVIDSQSFSSAVLVAAVSAIVAFAVVMVATAMISKNALRSRFTDWANRADRLVNERR
jgi:VIT1/CCC1 family predicted Fe2+/Mn2+ transporter